MEIAGRLKVGAKAAESLLTRAREAFRDAIVDSGGEDLRGIMEFHGKQSDLVESLIRTAGRRTEPPDDAYVRVLGAAAAFREKTARRRERTWLSGPAPPPRSCLRSR